MEQFLSAVRIALGALRVNKLRSALTMLGIIIGVAAVIATVAVGTGATERIQQQIASIGSNLIIVLPGSLTTSGLNLGSGNAATLTDEDAVAIAKDCPAVAAAAPGVRGGGQIVAGGNNWGTVIQGTTPDYLRIRDFQIASGSAFTVQDVDSAAKVVLIGKTVSDNLFNGSDPVGQVVRVKSIPFTVVGTLVPKGQSPTGQDQDDVVLIPISTAKKKVLGARQGNLASVGSIMVQAQDEGSINAAQDQIQALLRQRHHLQNEQPDDCSIRNLEEVFKAQESSAQVMAILLAAIASVSLIVGGIGIMNIMLVSVTERTREIGVRHAIGARAKDILAQFLVEAATLAVLGGAVGVVMGVAGAAAIAHFAGWNVPVRLGSVGVALVFSGLVGIGFGYYPARRAAFLDPIEALRAD